MKVNAMKKIAVPTEGYDGMGSRVSDHFGRCPTYTLLDDSGKVLEIIENTSEHMGGKGLPPELMKKYGSDILLCKSLGPRALELCEKLRIEVYVCQADTVSEIFGKWKKNLARKAGRGDVCEEHRE